MSRRPTLLVLTPSTGGYYFGALLTGVAREVTAAGGRVVVVQTLEPGTRSDEIGEPSDFATRVAWGEADGVLSITSAARGDFLAAIQARGVPVVVASSRLEGLSAPTAVPDNAGGTTAVVEHLLDHGHTRVGFVGNLRQHDIRDRYEAYVAALAARGLDADPRHLFVAPDNAQGGGRAAGEAFLAAADRPTAVVAATDRNAIGFLHAVQDAGLDVPGDVALAGFDDIEASAFASPALTTVDQPFDEVGALGARLVLAQLRGEAVPAAPHVAPATLVVRGSCGCAAAASPGPGDRGEVVAVARDRASERLRHALLTGHPDRDAAVVPVVGALLDRVDALAADPAVAEGCDDALRTRLADLDGALRRATGRPDVSRALSRALDEYVRVSAPPLAVAPVLAALRDAQAAAFLHQAEAVETMLDEQTGVDAGLLDTHDARSLDWLAGTHVLGAVLATWRDDGTLEVQGVLDRTGDAGHRTGERLDVESFPPASLVRTARPEDGLVCFVEPVRTRDREWGLLALVAHIELSTARETYHHWAVLLAAALEQRALEAAVRASEERYALVAQAAQDGLWERDLLSDTVYVSDRGRELLGLAPTGPVGSDVAERYVHPEDRDALRDAVADAVRTPGTAVQREFRHVREGEVAGRWRMLRALAVAEQDGTVRRVVGSVSDIDDRKRLEERLRLGALIDEVTGLPNRRLFLERLRHAIEHARRSPGHGYAVVFMDLDGFKLVNDSLGHLVGDQLLVVVAQRLREQLRAVDTAARFGGDEFAVLLLGPAPDEVLVIARRIQDAVAQPVELAGHEVAVTASVGITTSHPRYTDPEEVLRDADTAMYEAKGTERGSASVFDPEMHARATGRLRDRAELRTALAERQFVVHYQPIVALDGAGVSHFEALVRWEHPERGLLLPGAFLPALEDNNAIVALGAWVLDEVCRQVAEWDRTSEEVATVGVNLSHAEFWSKDLLARVRGTLERHGVPGERLVLEITESVIMTDPDDARRIMDGLHELGVRLHIDDFGTGQSSLHALRTLPVDAVKIDGSFIRQMSDVQTGELVRVIVEMGRVLGLSVVAECVETSDQASTLRAMGCDNAQGWLFSRAVPGADAGSMLGRALATLPA